MTKPLKAFAEKDRLMIARQRESRKTMGLGYWGAIDYLKKIGQKEQEAK